MLYTCNIDSIHMLYTSYIQFIYTLHKNIQLLYLFCTLFGHVPDKFGGQKWSFSKKFWGCLGYHLASSEVSETRSKNLFKNIFSKKNKSCADFFLYILAPELNSDLFSRAVLGIFRFFHIFHFSPLAGSYIPLLGP